MANFFGSSTTPGPAVNLRVQGSVQGRPRNVGAGLNRAAGNLIWYGDFNNSAVGVSGKGSVVSGALTKLGGTGNYAASFIVSIGEGIQQVNSIFNGNQIDFLVPPSAQVLADLQVLGIVPTNGNNTYHATFFLGDYAQVAWSFMSANHPTQALAYRGEAYAAFANLLLGTTPSLPAFTFEVLWALNSDIPALGPDANPADWVAKVLADPDWGVGFPSVLLGALTEYRTWCRATSMLISPVLVAAVAANQHLNEIMTGTTADFRWSGGVLSVLPYADAPVSGNGFTYTPSVAPVYAIQPGDFLPNQGGNDPNTPVAIMRKDPAQVLNQVRVEYHDRSNLYNPVVLYNSDDTSIVAQNRIKSSSVRAQHYFTFAAAASRSAALQMQREKVVSQFTFTLPGTFVLVDVLDILTLTEPQTGLLNFAVRVTEITEQADHSLVFVAEEFMGAVSAPIYARQQSLGAARNNSMPPGDINPPILFEPTDQLGQGLAVWALVSGQVPATWGGAEVWVSATADGPYVKQGTINGAARMGVSTADLPNVTPAVNGQTIDNTNPLAVDLTESLGTLTSGAITDMTGQVTRAYIGGEIVAYQNATLTGPNAYSLAPLVRGAFGSTIADHPAGTPFARLDDQVFALPFLAKDVGQTLYVKFLSFNVYGGGRLALSDVGAFAYTIQGTALASPLPNVANLRGTFVDGIANIAWDEISDFRPVRYEVRLGDTWADGIQLGTVAHPPFPTYGNGTYWVAGVSTPASGLTVYSATPQSISVAGSVLVNNIVATWDEQATGWTGIITGPGQIAGGSFETTAAGAPAYYEIPAAHIFDVLYSRPTRLATAWKVTGVSLNQNILTEADILNDPDILSSAASAFVQSWVEIAIAATPGTDVFGYADVFAPADIFAGTNNFGAWQKFSPGMYLGQQFKARLVIQSNDPGIKAVALAFSNTADVPLRTDHLTAYSLIAGGATINFTPDGSITAVPFKGGPGTAVVPNVQVSWNETAGDSLAITALSLSQVTLQVLNGGIGVARTISAVFQGW